MMKKEKMCLLGLLPALTVPMTLPCLAGNNAELPPNIIVVLTDDMGYGDIGIYGGKFIPTPNIDRMAEEGSRFNQYYSASPISSPSRCGLLTGMYPGKWHITTYLQGKAGNKAAEMADYLDPSAPTLPKVMKNAIKPVISGNGIWEGDGMSGMLPLLSLMDMTNIAAPMKALNRIRYLRQRIGFGLRRIV